VTVFVADTTPEAELVTRSLRDAGNTVVDVLLSMLVARVAVQRPRVVVVDADAEGALDIIERMRELPGADDIHVLFVARAGGVIATPEEAIAHEGSGFFVRPVDVDALLQKVRLLAVGARAAAIPSEASGLPPVQSSTPGVSSSPPSLPPASMRASIAPASSETRPSVPPSSHPSKSPSDPPPAAARRVTSLAPPVSAELRQLLAEAEQRVHVAVEHESVVPSPEEEIEAVLPADMLAALDEPLDEDEDDEEPLVPPRSAGPSRGTRERPSARSGPRSAQVGPAEVGSIGSGATRAGPGTGAGETPANPAPGQTHGRTQAGSSGDSASTTGASHDRAAAEVRDTAAPYGRAAGPPTSDAPLVSRSNDPSETMALGVGEAMRAIARAIAARTTASLCIAALQDGAGVSQRRLSSVERRVVLREGDVVTTSSAAEDESLLAFLGARGDLPRETVRRLATKFPAHGRHAGAALVARGYLPQDQMWPTLRAHAEWLLARALQTAHGKLLVESEPPGRLGVEPSVFGGSTGAAVFVEVVRRIVSPAEAIERLGGMSSQLVEGPEARLLDECALDPDEAEQVRDAQGRTIRDVVDAALEGDLVTVLFALGQLGVLDVVRAAGHRDDVEDASTPDDRSAAAPLGRAEVSALDSEAVRERVRARIQLVEDGDYFALLGVPRDATGYEVRRAFLELRRTFEPARVLTPDVVDLADEVRKIAAVLEEAYDVLKDAARRERYRRAIEAAPDPSSNR
jgi:hypothetical protein